jgi:hypothetical protein
VSGRIERIIELWSGGRHKSMSLPSGRLAEFRHRQKIGDVHEQERQYSVNSRPTNSMPSFSTSTTVDPYMSTIKRVPYDNAADQGLSDHLSHPPYYSNNNGYVDGWTTLPYTSQAEYISYDSEFSNEGKARSSTDRIPN